MNNIDPTEEIAGKLENIVARDIAVMRAKLQGGLGPDDPRHGEAKHAQTMVEAPKALASLELRRRGGQARRALSPLFTTTYVNRGIGVDGHEPLAIIESLWITSTTGHPSPASMSMGG